MIEFKDVSKRFQDGTVAVEDFNLEIPSRRVTVLVGSSGSGKTTLLRMVNRMVDPSSGQVTIDDVDVASKDPVKLRRGIGYVMQSSGLLPHRKVLDNITTVLRLERVPKAEANETARELMNTVGLDPQLANRYPRQLSGGQQQRVGVARALAADPNILLMDEPFGAVDPLVRKELQRELLRIQATLSKTVLFVTHDIDEAFLLGDQVVVMRERGEIAQVGTPAEIMTGPADDFVAEFIGQNSSKRVLHASPADSSGRTILDERGHFVGVISGQAVAQPTRTVADVATTHRDAAEPETPRGPAGER